MKDQVNLPYTEFRPKIVPWSEEQIHNLVIESLGEDVNFPEGSEVLVLLYEEPEILDSETQLRKTDQERQQDKLGSKVVKILRMGKDAFRNPNIYPSGRPYNYGDWVHVSGPVEARLCNGTAFAFLGDHKFVGRVSDPAMVKTTLNGVYEHGVIG